MKNKFVISLIGLFIITSCQKEDLNNIEQETSDITENSNVIESKEEDGYPNIISSYMKINDGSWKEVYVGFGYHPTLERRYKSVLEDDYEINYSTTVPKALDATIQIVKTNRELRDFIDKSGSFQSYSSLDLDGLDHQNTWQFNRETEISQQTITVAARISVQREKYWVEPMPFLSQDFSNQLYSGSYDNFKVNYGPMYVDEQIRGGDVYYLYTFRTGNFSPQEEAAFAQKARSYISELFDRRDGTILTSADRSQITAALKKEGLYTNVFGFKPEIVKSVADFNREMSRFQNYLDENPRYMATVAVKFRPYRNLTYATGATNVQNSFDYFVTSSNCLYNMEMWNFIRAELEYVSNNHPDPNIKSQADAAINEVRDRVYDSWRCVNSITPSGNEYAYLRNLTW